MLNAMVRIDPKTQSASLVRLIYAELNCVLATGLNKQKRICEERQKENTKQHLKIKNLLRRSKYTTIYRQCKKIGGAYSTILLTAYCFFN